MSEVARQEENSDAPADAPVTPEARREAALCLIDGHDAVFRRTARRYSICADDADDAYQRALEILLTKAPGISGDNLVRWMQTVTKREALAVRRLRERLLSDGWVTADEDDDRDPLDAIPADGPGPGERVARRERLIRSDEALRALKPQELQALTLKAQGYSYAEIRQITGWTYTKVNRCMAEGRKRFLAVFSEIERGDRCDQFTAALSALADGEEKVTGTDELEIHLRGCATCRARLRSYRAVPGRILGLLPVMPAAGQAANGSAQEWLIARAGAAVERLREVGYSVLSRGAGDGGAQTASLGGTRGTGMAVVGKLLAVCGATAAGGVTCIATGLVDPATVTGKEHNAPAVHRSAAPAPPAVPSVQALADSPAEAETPVEAVDAARPAPPERPPVVQQFGFESQPSPAGNRAAPGGDKPAGSGARPGRSTSTTGGGGGFGFE